MTSWKYHIKTEDESACVECRDGSDLPIGEICQTCQAVGYKPADIGETERRVNEEMTGPVFA